jgi:hypothetical protein
LKEKKKKTLPTDRQQQHDSMDSDSLSGDALEDFYDDIPEQEFDEDYFDDAWEAMDISPLEKLDRKHTTAAAADADMGDVMDFLWHFLYTPQDEYYRQYPNTEDLLNALSVILQKLKFIRTDPTCFSPDREKSRIHLLLDILKVTKGPGLKKQKLKKNLIELLKNSENEQMTGRVALKKNSYESMVKGVAQVSLSSEAFKGL